MFGATEDQGPRTGDWLSLVWAFFAAVVVLNSSAASAANKASEQHRARGFELAYNLDHEEAIREFRAAIAADPSDAAAYRSLAVIVWLNELFNRGQITVDDYLGSVTKPNIKRGLPPAETSKIFRENILKAIGLAEQRVASTPKDPSGHYELGASVGVNASYSATIEGKIMSAFGAARKAYNEHEEVMRLDPKRKDAALIVGTYRYAVSTLSMPMRWMAYLVGFGGGREEGLRLMEESAAYPGEHQTDAHFALILIYNRERRYADALRMLGWLRQKYPRNRLLWLESGATAARGRRLEEAESFLLEGLRQQASDQRPRAFGEEAMFRYKLGATRLMASRLPQAADDLKAALALPGRVWVKGRIHAELGKLADLRGDRAAAQREYQMAVQLSASDEDPRGEADARRLLKDGYKAPSK